MLRPIATSLALVAALLTLLASSARAQDDRPRLTTVVSLTGRGGAVFKVPAWKEARKEAEVAVFEHVTATEVTLLVVSIEEGPAKDGPVDWEQVRKNVVDAANEAGGKLELTIGEPFEGATGFEGRRMKGRLMSGETRLDVALVALVRDGRFVSVSVLTSPEGRDGAGLAADVGAIVRLGD